MAETYQEKIARIKKEDLENFMALASADFVLFDNVECAEHYTFVCMIPDNIAKKMVAISNRIMAIDPMMIFNPLDKLHLTIFHCSVNEDIDGMIKIMKNQRRGIFFNLEGIRASSLGMGISAFPEDETMLNLRRELFAYIGKEAEDNARGVISWITLARSSKQPPQQLLNFLLLHMNDEFGKFVPAKIELFKSRDKNLINAEKLAEFNLEE